MSLFYAQLGNRVWSKDLMCKSLVKKGLTYTSLVHRDTDAHFKIVRSAQACFKLT